MAVGYWWKQMDWQLNKWILWIGGCSAITIELLLLHKVGFMWLSPKQLPIYVVPAIAGTMMVFDLCRCIIENRNSLIERLARGLEYIGKYTLAIMALHMLSLRMVSYILIRVNHLPIERLQDFPVMYDYANVGGVLLYTIVGICVPLICVWVWQWGLEKVKSVRCKV